MRAATLVLLTTALLCVPSPGQGETPTAPPKPPNIVVLLADDLGWHDVGYHGSEIRTPHIDALSRGGTRLESFYVQPVCSPTRAAFLTGRYPIRTGLQVGVIRPSADYGLPLNERLLPEALQERGYETAICGKWHLGLIRRAYLPTSRGFEHQYGHYTGMIDYFTHRRGAGEDWNRDDEPLHEEGYTTELLARESVRLIEQRDRERPLFLYVAFNAVHTPLQVPRRYLDMYPEIERRNRRRYAGMTTALDDAIGRIVAACKENGMEKNTLIVFASDNGGQNRGRGAADNRPLRAGKGTLYEGGVRVPAVCYWPGHLRPGSVVQAPLHIVDLLPTLLGLAGASAKGMQPLDGKDAWPAIAHGAASPHEEILLNATPRTGAIRVGDWKLVRHGPRYELFDVVKDLSERVNLAEQRPEKLAELKARLEDLAGQAVPPRNRQGRRRRRGFTAPAFWGHPERGKKGEPPNLVFVMADDMGYGDPRCYNEASKIPTPNLDRLAGQGMRFLDAHSPSAVCSPTRYGVLTGRYAWRSRLKRGVLGGYSPSLIEPGRMTVASLLQGHGYATGGFGKWHLGLGAARRADYTKPLRPGPLDLGFQRYFGIPASLDMPPYVFIDDDHPLQRPSGKIARSEMRRRGGAGFFRGGAIAPDFRHADVLPRITDAAIEFLEQQQPSHRPFFVYLPFSAPHTPWLPTQEFVGRSQAGPYGDFVAQVDAMVGRVMTTLERLGQARDTLLIVTSDNGAHWLPADIKKYGHRANGALRGQKADIWEGGHRVPFLARWPGRIAPGSTFGGTICHTDLLATVAEILGVALPDGAGEDSFSFLPALLGERLDAPLREATVHHSANGTFAIRKGRFKLVLGRGSGGFSKPRVVRPKEGEARGQLYDLVADPGEQENLWLERPEIVARLGELLARWRAQGHSRPLVARPVR